MALLVGGFGVALRMSHTKCHQVKWKSDEYSGLASSIFEILNVGFIYKLSRDPAVFLEGWLYSLVVLV